MKIWFLNHLNSLLLTIVAILSPIKALLLTVGFLIVADFIFGICRAYIKKETINSRKMSNTIGKIILYNIAIISVYFLDRYLICSGLNLEKVVAALIGIVEIKSLDESFKTLFNWSIWDLLKKTIQRGSSNTKDLLDDIDKAETLK